MPIMISGKEVPQTAHEDVLVLPRGEEAIVIRAKAIHDFEEFSKVCPDPEPPGALTKDGWVPNKEDETYKKRFEQHNIKRIGWMVLRSLQEITWDKVDADNPKTWDKWQEDLEDSGFTSVECNLVLALVIDVNSLNEQKLKGARDSFIRGQALEAKRLSSQNTELESTPSGKLAKDSE